METKNKLDLDKNGTPVYAKKYRGMIGALMYLTSSRPDIVHATCLCARYQARPTEKHLKEVKRSFVISEEPMSRHLQEYFWWNSIVRRKASELVLEETRLYSVVNLGSGICVFIRLLCSSPLDENTVNGLWLLL
nr:hypothetical protein [Tanacetum cinerariifolium]